MDNAGLILNRRREVEQEIARLQTQLKEYDKELVELATAERVLTRLTGARGPAPSEAVGPSTAKGSAEGAAPVTYGNPPTLPQLILTALSRAHRSGLTGLEPKDIADAILLRNPTAKVSGVNSIAWRMWKRGQLAKDEGSSLYRLPDKEKPADLLSPAGEQSAGLSDQPSAQGGEARPGGGA
jgi:hypothetical protein